MDYVFYYYAYQQSCHQIQSAFFIFYLSFILQYFYEYHPYHSSISIKAWQSLQHFMLAPSRLLISNWYFSSYGYSSYSSISGSLLNLFSLSIRVFFHRHWRFTGQSRKGGDHLLFTIPLPPAHEHWDIYLQLCKWDDYHVFLIATLVFT